MKYIIYRMYDPDNFKYITSIDIGVKNLGISLISLYSDFTIHQVEWFELINITDFVHLDEESREGCHLYHDKTCTDYLEHVFYLHHHLFAISTWVLLERQPFEGYVVVEQLIFSKYRDKAVLISPNSIHCFLGWTKQHLTYDERKIKSIKVAKKYICKDYLIDYFETHERQHDIADSICMVIYWCNKKHVQWIKDEHEKRLNQQIQYAKENNLYHSHLFIEKFRYIH